MTIVTINELIYLIIGCWISLVLVWLYIKFRTRNLPTVKQALAFYEESSKNFEILLEEQSEILNRRITALNTERDKLSEDFDEPDKTLH